jgi:hypothetical protein
MRAKWSATGKGREADQALQGIPETAGAIAGECEAEEEMILISRTIRRKRGSWWQVPKDLPDTPDEG